MKPKLIIFTDLDGTMLDSKYSFEKARPALALIKKKKIPLIICSSKTRTEIEHYRRKLGNPHPFISENGGGIFIPKNYFKVKSQKSRQTTGGQAEVRIQKTDKYDIIQLGAKYTTLRKTIKKLRSKGFDVRGFGDMNIREIAGLTGLCISEAEMARHRDFDEPFVAGGGKALLNKLKRNIRSMGLTYTESEFHHIMGSSDKGRAVHILTGLYKKQFGKIITSALGDGPNDTAMFKNVDYPILVQKHTGSYDKRVRMKKLIKADGAGPEGWNKAILRLLDSSD